MMVPEDKGLVVDMWEVVRYQVYFEIVGTGIAREIDYAMWKQEEASVIPRFWSEQLEEYSCCYGE